MVIHQNRKIVTQMEDGAKTISGRGTHAVGGKVMGYGEDGEDGEERQSPKSSTDHQALIRENRERARPYNISWLRRRQDAPTTR